MDRAFFLWLAMETALSHCSIFDCKVSDVAQIAGSPACTLFDVLGKGDGNRSCVFLLVLSML
jgi:hypothetical protein